MFPKSGGRPRSTPASAGSTSTAPPTRSSRSESYEAEHDWLTIIRLPAYAPDLNPVEAVWSFVRRATVSTAFGTPGDLDRKLRRKLRRTQLRPHLIDGCLTATGLAVNPPTPA
ncbi:transposase [Streptomyces sp. NPDC127051]|uniref:transposase n=1 Tax=Streptomyces sp. NPDC127051 TaxID=3347119 RepID=UPI00364A535E